MNYFYIYNGFWYAFDLYTNPYKTILKETMNYFTYNGFWYAFDLYTNPYKTVLKYKNNKIKDIEMDKLKYV